MSHEHEHDHHHQSSNKKVLLISFLLVFSFMIVEAIGGVVTNSLALLSDAGHMLSDAVSLGLALFAFIISERAVTLSKTFGYKRMEVLAACINGLTLLGISIFILIEAIGRFQEPAEVATTGMLIISSIGLLINIIIAIIMFKGGNTDSNLNMRSAFLHVISDMLGSIGAITAALLMIFFDFAWADPLASILVAVLILRGGFSVTKKSLHILLEGTPADVDPEAVIAALQQPDAVQAVHDLHIWSITSGLNALTCHVVLQDNLTVEQSTALLIQMKRDIVNLNVQHVTIQMEYNPDPHDQSILCSIEHQHETLGEK